MEKPTKENDFFRSSDLNLIACAQLFGHQIEAMNRSNPEKIIFSIKRNDELDKLIEDFWSRSLRVEPVAYFESLKLVKSRIYQE